MHDPDRDCWIDVDNPCPKCGTPLYRNAKYVWCGYKADPHALACDYGIAEVVTVEQHEEAQ